MAAKRTCQHPDCDRPHYGLGWCLPHYTRVRRTGDPGEGGSRRSPANGQNCSVEGCSNPVVAKGICNTHRMRLRQLGSLDLPVRVPRICSVPGCGRKAKADWLCGKHYQRQRTNGDPSVARRYGQTTCDVPGCNEPHDWGGRCQRHANQFLAYGEVGPPRQRRYKDGEVCEMPGCRERPKSNGLCTNHYVIVYSQPKRRGRKAEASGDATKDQVIARILYYGSQCWIPGCTEPGTAIDHVKPLSKGGANWPANLRPICQRHNSQKSNLWPFDPAMLGGPIQWH